MKIPTDDVDPGDIGPGANLRKQNLMGADLRDANLSEANLRGAALGRVNLSEANLRGADLSEANLREADLEGADLGEADLSEADLSEADLEGADLEGVDLSGSNISAANLNLVDLRRAELSGLSVDGATTIRQSTQIDNTAQNWSEIVNLYDSLARIFEEQGATELSREFRRLRRSATANRERAAGNVLSFLRIELARSVFDIGVTQVSILIILLYSICTSYYFYIGIENPFYYSTVVFTTSASAASAPIGITRKIVVMVETFGGTLLIVLLGAVISSRLD